MARSTSIRAYKKICEQGLVTKMKWKVYDALFCYGPATANEVFYTLGLNARNAANITTRLSELKKMGITKKIGKRNCTVTGMYVTLWEVTKKLPKNYKKKKTKNKIVSEIKILIGELKRKINQI